MKHSNISIFVPHLGCPCRCSFCNQRHITGTAKQPDESDIDNAVKIAVSSKRYDSSKTQLAFFGGSFTAIGREYMTRLLKCAKKYVDDGSISGVRISTRPDFIDDEILNILKHYGVSAIELGAQSMSDEVLEKNKRGHTVRKVIDSSRLIKQYGFELGLQMMTGLYGDSDETAIETAEKIIEIKPDTVRIYPTIVLENTELCDLYRKGLYTPQTVEQATSLGAILLKKFNENNINVIRFGLHTIDEEYYVAGPWHPALAEITYSKMYNDIVINKLKEYPSGNYILLVNNTEVSKLTGQHKCNIESFKKQGYTCKVKADKAISIYDVKIIKL